MVVVLQCGVSTGLAISAMCDFSVPGAQQARSWCVCMWVGEVGVPALCLLQNVCRAQPHPRFQRCKRNSTSMISKLHPLVTLAHCQLSGATVWEGAIEGPRHIWVS